MQTKTVLAHSLFAALAAFAAGAAQLPWESVVEPESPKPYEKTAANELKEYLKRVFEGGELSVDGARDVRFHVGDTQFARERGLAPTSFKDEEWAIKSFGGDVVLAGGGSRGTLYAVFHFLEDCCGVRWWFTGDEDVPERLMLNLPSLDRRGKPFFMSRNVFVGDGLDCRTAVRRRLNGMRGDIPPELGGGFVTGSPHHCHVWDRYVPWEQYGRAHPEWVSLVGGERRGGMSRGQLCLTNPEVVDLVEKGVRESIASDRERVKREPRRSVPLMYDLSMNDNMSYCQCANCAAETAKYGHSGLQLKFANEIARRIGRDCPELKFSMLAYLYSEPAPTGGVRADDNVVVRLCTTRQNMAGGINDADNAFVHDLVESWRPFARNLFIWDYAILYRTPVRGFPFASEFHIPGRYRFFAENNVTGVFLEHEEPHRPDMYELKFYLETQMMEDPFQKPSRLYADFMTRYYGRAAGKIKEARARLDAIRRERKAFIYWFPSFNAYNFVKDEEIDEMERLFGEAAAIAAGDAKLERRVARAKSSMDRLRDYRKTFGHLHAPEDGVSETPFFDFPVDAGPYVYELHDRTRTLFSCVEDAELGGRKAWRLDVDIAKSSYYDMPFEMGVYDFVEKRQVVKQRWERPAGPGYNWYDLGEVDLPESFIVHFTRAWAIDTPAGAPGLAKSRRGVKALVKFTGPKYFEGSTESNAVYIARTVFY